MKFRLLLKTPADKLVASFEAELHVVVARAYRYLLRHIDEPDFKAEILHSGSQVWKLWVSDGEIKATKFVLPNH